MKSTVETLGPTRVRLAIEVPFAELEPSLKKAYREIAQQVNIPGFRRGKAPAAAAICYPFLLQAFHAVVGTQAITPSPLTVVGATLILAVAFVVPFLSLSLARRRDADPGARRLA